MTGDIKKLKILHISRYDSKAGGGAAFRTHFAFLEAGYFSRILVRESAYDKGETIYRMVSARKITYRRVKNKIIALFKRLAGLAVKTDPSFHFQGTSESKLIFTTSELLSKIPFKPDVIILYFVDYFLIYQNVFELYKATGAKIYIYPMDMGPITGGCHYAWDCLGYQADCKNCPAILNSRYKSIANNNLALKKKYIDQTNISIIAGGVWIKDAIYKSSLFKNKPLRWLMLPIDSAIFKPLPSEISRKYFGLDLNKKIIFFGAQSLSEKRKGIVYLLQSLVLLKALVANTKLENNIQLLVAGRSDTDFLKALPFPYRFVGLLDNNEELPKAYNAADVFVCPSIQDAGPMMITEAQLCGTPVVSFDMGLAQDLVNEKTGYKAALHDVSEFAAGIRQVLMMEEKAHFEMRKTCVSSATGKVFLKGIVTEFEQIFKEDLADVEERR